jgi:multidrug efflux system membrane fusion protein
MKRQYWISATLLLVLLAWLGSGQLPDSNARQAEPPASTQPASSAQARMSVEAVRSTARPVVRKVVLQGQALPLRRAQIPAETAGRVAELLVDKGQRVEAGDLLARIAIDDRRARLAQAQALVARHEADTAAVRKLFKQGLQAETLLREREADLASARAALESIRLDIARTEIRAPFAGVIDDRQIELGERLAAGSALFTLIDDSALKISAQLPQRDAAEVTTDMPASVRLITGETLQGRVNFVAAAAGSETRSFTLEVAVANPNALRAVGMSAEVAIPVETLQGHFLSPGMLALDRGDELGIKSVDADGRVSFHSVEIISTEADGVWVGGLPSEIQIITLGQGFVEAGDQVDVAERGAATI